MKNKKMLIGAVVTALSLSVGVQHFVSAEASASNNNEIRIDFEIDRNAGKKVEPTETTKPDESVGDEVRIDFEIDRNTNTKPAASTDNEVIRTTATEKVKAEYKGIANENAFSRYANIPKAQRVAKTGEMASDWLYGVLSAACASFIYIINRKFNGRKR